MSASAERDAVADTAGGRALAPLVAALADDKAALGRRYGEWAVSAPTLESAVAAAAMAQDELGHARATYPLLRQLGAQGDEDEQRAPRLALLEHELPDWESFVAANLVLDGALTAFVEACEGSAFEPLAQRARKILQEEHSHRAHARAWTRRLAGDERRREPLTRALARSWEQAARWLGPDDEGSAAAVADGLLARGPGALRERLRADLGALLATAQLDVPLPEPGDWAGWSADVRR